MGRMPDTELMDRVRELRERGRTPKEIARALKVPPSTVAPLIRALGAAGGQEKQARLVGCWVNLGWSSSVQVNGHHPDWKDRGGAEGGSGLISLLVARERGSRAVACGYLVDTWCLGVKNAVPPKSVDRRRLPEFVGQYFAAYPEPPAAASLEFVRQVVFGSIEYARGLGFEPHPDFAKAADHLGEWDGACDLTFGRDGMPCYVEGPHDNTGHIMRTLRKNAGDGNFHYVMGLKLCDGPEVAAMEAGLRAESAGLRGGRRDAGLGWLRA
jgi:hypothetical protein